MEKKIIEELKSGKYNLSQLERIIGAPKSTLLQVSLGCRKLPKKYFKNLIDVLKIK